MQSRSGGVESPRALLPKRQHESPAIGQEREPAFQFGFLFRCCEAKHIFVETPGAFQVGDVDTDMTGLQSGDGEGRSLRVIFHHFVLRDINGFCNR